jgi:glycosyltransferase involved in cell wall biosynthesis
LQGIYNFFVKTNTNKYDVQLSVWNRFFSFEQCTGLVRNGLSVHWVGTGRPPKEVQQKTLLYLSTLILRLHFKTGLVFLQNWSRLAFERSSKQYAGYSKVVWAYLEYNNGLLKRCRKMRIPTILDIPIGHQRTCQEVLARESAKYGLPYLTPSLERWTQRYENAYEMADWLAVGSQFVRQTLIDRGVASNKIIVIPYGVNVSYWKRAFQSDKNRHGKMIFIYTASVGLRKGVQYLLQAWRKANLSDAEMWICGNNYLPKHPDFDNYPDSVKFFGKKSHAELLEMYKKAHIYVLPSLFEGLARSGLEAMASGLPCIATWESGLTDFIRHGENGWVVPSANSQALVDILLECSSNRRNLDSIAMNAFETGQQNSWTRYGDRCAETVRRIFPE